MPEALLLNFWMVLRSRLQVQTHEANQGQTLSKNQTHASIIVLKMDCIMFYKRLSAKLYQGHTHVGTRECGPSPVNMYTPNIHPKLKNPFSDQIHHIPTMVSIIALLFLVDFHVKLSAKIGEPDVSQQDILDMGTFLDT